MDDKIPPPPSYNQANPTYPQQQPQQMHYQGGYYPNQQYAQPQIVVQQQPQVVVVGGGNCPNCRRGVLVEEYGCCAIFLAIFFFPIGVLCCLAMRERVCTNCRARF